MEILWPEPSVGYDWLNVTGLVETVPIDALMIPHELMSVEQTVTDADPLTPAP